MRIPPILLIAVFTVLLGASALPAAAGPGALDPSFDNDGLQTASGSNPYAARDLELFPNGESVAAGAGGAQDLGHVYSSFRVVRYSKTGDIVFSRTLDFGRDNESSATAVSILPTDKILAIGNRTDTTCCDEQSGLVMTRLRPDGVLDPNFGGDGRVARVGARGSDVAPLDGGRFAVVGSAGEDKGFAVLAYLPDGTPDSSFGDAGVVTVDVDGDEEARAVLVLPDGRILVAGLVGGDVVPEGFVLARFLANGSPDASFGDQGVVTIDPTPADPADDVSEPSIALLSNGDVILSGSAAGQIALVRFDGSGVPVDRFGGDGVVLLDLPGGEERATGLAVHKGEVLVVGWQRETSGDAIALLGRLSRRGRPDLSFGPEGFRSFQLGNFVLWSAVQVYDPSRVMVAGAFFYDSSESRWVVARFLTS